MGVGPKPAFLGEVGWAGESFRGFPKVPGHDTAGEVGKPETVPEFVEDGDELPGFIEGEEAIPDYENAVEGARGILPGDDGAIAGGCCGERPGTEFDLEDGGRRIGSPGGLPKGLGEDEEGKDVSCHGLGGWGRKENLTPDQL